MSYPTVISKYVDYPIITNDYRQDSKAMYKEDFLKFQTANEIGLIISNPPFCDALKFIQHSLTISKKYVVFLLRLNFFGSQERSEWFKNHMPVYTYVHSKRLKFLNTSGTDSIEYAHLVWKVGEFPRFTRMRLI